jgi:hypothetical protein
MILLDMGNTPEQARSTIETIMRAPNIAQGTKETAKMQFSKLQLESFRPKYDIITSQGRRQIAEMIFDPLTSGTSEYFTEKIGSLSELYQNTVFNFTTGGTLYTPINAKPEDRIRLINQRAVEQATGEKTEDLFSEYATMQSDALGRALQDTGSNEFKSARLGLSALAKKALPTALAVGQKASRKSNKYDLARIPELRTKLFKGTFSDVDRQDVINLYANFPNDPTVTSFIKEVQQLVSMGAKFDDSTQRDYISNIAITNNESARYLAGMGEKIMQRYGSVLNAAAENNYTAEDAQAFETYAKDFSRTTVKSGQEFDAIEELSQGYFGKSFMDLSQDQLNTLGRRLQYSASTDKTGFAQKLLGKLQENRTSIPGLGDIKEQQKKLEKTYGSAYKTLKEVTGSELPSSQDLKTVLMGMYERIPFAEERDDILKYLGYSSRDELIKARAEILINDPNSSKAKLLIEARKKSTPQGLFDRSDAYAFRSVYDFKGFETALDITNVANAGALTVQQAQALRERMLSTYGADIQTKNVATDILERMSSPGTKISDEELATAFGAWQKSEDISVSRAGTVGSLIYGGGTQDDIRTAYANLLRSPGLGLPETRINEETNAFMDAYSKAPPNMRSGILSRALATTVAAADAGGTIATGAKAGTGYISPETMSSLVQSIDKQTKSAEALLKIYEKLDPSGFMTDDKVKMDKIGKAFADTVILSLTANQLTAQVGGGYAVRVKSVQ